MALMKTWYNVAAAADKFGIEVATLLLWVEEGVVRCERDDGKVARVQIDDVRLQVNQMLDEVDGGE